jgi:hypothetical protein
VRRHIFLSSLWCFALRAFSGVCSGLPMILNSSVAVTLYFFFSYFLLNPYFDEFLSHQKQILEITSTCRLIGRVATIRVSPLIGGLMFLCFSYNVVNVHK